jgi:hypothetical protein
VNLLSFPVPFCLRIINKKDKEARETLCGTDMLYLNCGRQGSCLWLARAYLGFLEAEADEVEYLPQLSDVARVVDGLQQLDEAEMPFAIVELRGAAGLAAAADLQGQPQRWVVVELAAVRDRDGILHRLCHELLQAGWWALSIGEEEDA